MGDVIQLHPASCPQRGHQAAVPGTVLSLRGRLFERAVDAELARRMADEREALLASNGCPPRRLRVVRP